MRAVMGIDQSYTSTGIFIAFNDEDEFAGKIITTEPDKENPLQMFDRSRYIADQIVELIHEHNVGRVVIEGLPMGNIKGNSNRDLAGLQYTIVNAIKLAYEDGVEIEVVSPTMLKKFATGKGTASKVEMFEAAPMGIQEGLQSQFKKSAGLYDVVDAFWLCMFGIKELKHFEFYDDYDEEDEDGEALLREHSEPLRPYVSLCKMYGEWDGRFIDEYGNDVTDEMEHDEDDGLPWPPRT